MARANKGGWDFIGVGNTYQYQYKRDNFVAEVTVLEDKSDDEQYVFRLQVDKATDKAPHGGEFEVTAYKHRTYTISAPQFLETGSIACDYLWDRSMLEPIDKCPETAVLEASFSNLKYLYNKFMWDDCSLREDELPEMLKVVDLLKQAEATMEAIYKNH